MSSKKSTNSKTSPGWLIETCGVVMSKVGMIGFIVIAIVVYIYKYVPQDLKNELTKTWLLFQGPQSNIICIFIVIAIGVLFIFQQIFYHRAIKLKDQRIQELAEEKKILQEKLLNKPLKSTNPKKP